MKRSKRQESSIIIYFSFYFILLLALIIFSISSLYPKINEIELKKDITNKTYNDLISLNKEGISYWEFNKLKNQFSLNSYQKELLNSLDINFYNTSFKNTSDNDYLTFLEDLKVELDNQVEKEKFKEKENQIIKILPPYSESDVNGEEDLLTDFKFINYIENIIATFWLDYNDEIGINELRLLDEFSDEWKKSKLDTDIYYIPLDFNIEGTKYNIINFLYYLEKVWNVKITQNQLELHSQNEDKFLYRGVKIMMKSDQKLWSQRSEYDKYNIFENQLIDIQELSFWDYIDNWESTNNNRTVSLAQRIKESQWDEKISIDLSLNFYVKWVQNIKIINHIKAYIKYFNTTKLIVTKKMWDKTLNTIEKNIITKINSDLKEMTKELKNINVSISKQENLNETLMSVNKYTNLLHIVNWKIWYNEYISNFITEYTKLTNTKDLSEENSILFSYLDSIKSEVDWLKKSTWESLSSHKTRLNNKKLFQKVIQFQKNIELKK